MAVSKQKKQEILEDIKKNLTDAKSVAFTSNNALTVEEISDIRGGLREVGAKMMLAKKTLIKIAFKDVYDVELSDEMLDGQIAMLLSFEDEVGGLGKTNDYIKKLGEEKIKFMGSYLDGNLSDAEQTKALAKLPSKEVLLGQLVWVISAPTSKLVGTLDSLVASFVRVVEATKSKAEAEGKETIGDLLK